ncbi:acylphosphatase-2 isoform X2 [Drosophila sechellia]|uniref:acylphosphatase-2 isoform X2 n=1 Tax=Drosophila sechellia TaxID=7238 RepID=UPI0013DD9250|nr:acylphosphatase-2 isoform X2 [Drosophila sechellia]
MRRSSAANSKCSGLCKYTLRRAQKLGVRGWCKNTNENTVKGEIQAHRNSFESMRLWLKHTGSPTSRIDKCIFSETTELAEFTFTNFTIVVD